MLTKEVLVTLSKILHSPPLNDIQELVFRQAWEGQTYTEIAASSGYEESYIRDVGAKLWQRLSTALGQKVTKSNLHSVVEQYIVTGKKLASEPQPLIARFANPSTREKIAAINLLSDSLEFPSGPVPLNSCFYVERPPVEELSYSEISKPGSVIRIKAPMKMGKSSLMVRIISHAVRVGYRTVNLDFHTADEAIFASLDKFLRWFCANISRQLNLKPMLDDYWDEDMGSKVSCTLYFEGYLLEQIDSPLVLALNEVNRVFEHPLIAQDFLPLLRFWYEQAKQVETFQKLRLVVVHSTEIYIPLQINQSPFNVGLPIKLPQFTQEQVQDLAQRHGLDWKDGQQAQQLVAMVGGNPYLVRVALYHICRSQVTLEQLLQEAFTSAGIYSDHLRSLLVTLRREAELAVALKQVVSAKGSVCLEPILTYKLDSMGLVKLDGDEVTPSCELYRLYFRESSWEGADLS